MMAGGSAAAPAGNVQSLHPQGNNVSIQSLKSGLLDTLQSQRHSGLDTNLQSILALVSGALFAAAILVLAAYSVSSSESDSPYAPGFFWSAVGCACVYVLTRFVSSDLAVGATTAFVPLAATSILLLFGQSLEEGKIGLSLLLLGLAYGAAWALPILRGRPALLASALLSTGTGIVILLMQSSITRAADCSDSSYSNCYDDPSNLFNAIARQSSTLFLIIGIGLLAVAWTMDRKDWPMLGRVFIGGGIYFEGIGAFGVLESSDDRTAGSILLAIAGVLLVLVAVQRSRKTSLIIGGIGAFSGIIAFVSALTSSNESPAAFIFLALLISAGLGFLCIKKSAAVQAAIQSIGKP
jgi:hypothetical protein